MAQDKVEPVNKSSRIKKLPVSALKAFKRTWFIALIIGLLIGGAGVGYLRGRTIRYYKAQLSGTQDRLNQVQAEWENSFADKGSGDCYDTNTGIGGECPSITVNSARKVADNSLPDGQYFMIVEVDISNDNKNAAPVDPNMFKLKDKDNFIFSAVNTAPGYEGEGTTYDSINSVQTLLEQYNLSIGSGEKVRSNLIFKVSSTNGPFLITYVKAKSKPFNL